MRAPLIRFNHLKQSRAEGHSQAHKMLSIKVHVGCGAEVRPTERGLERVGARQLELSSHSNTRTALLVLLDLERARLEAEAVRSGAGEHLGEESELVGPRRLALRVHAIYKDILFVTVAVQVAEHNNLALATEALEEQLGVVHGWVEQRGRDTPLSVEVVSTETASIVAHDHPVGVQHWHSQKHKSQPQLTSNGVRRAEEVQDAFHHPGGTGLSRVHSCSEEHTPAAAELLVVVVRWRLVVNQMPPLRTLLRPRCDSDDLAGVARKSLAQSGPFDVLTTLGAGGELLQVQQQLRHGVRIVVSQVAAIVLVFKLNVER
mmetsp:Transcript_21458/g.50481  ORF Transcript_21458/g.50481 Transcript_21458/m.50481 type:complete len:317 (-) Transcript_21458:2470-3420(-)